MVHPCRSVAEGDRVESNERFYRRRAVEERMAAQRAMTEQARAWHAKLAEDFAERALICAESPPIGVALTASPAWAQDPPPVVITGGLDFVNQYNFRGIRQNTDGISIWPYVDFGFTPYRGDGGLKTVGVNLGTWNAFNTQINEDDFGTDNKWYESDIYATLGLGFGPATLGFTYTAYTSPADLFTTVHELAVKASGAASAAAGGSPWLASP